MLLLVLNQSGKKKFEPWIQGWAIPEVAKKAEDQLNFSPFNRMWLGIFGVFKFKYSHYTFEFTTEHFEESSANESQA